MWRTPASPGCEVRPHVAAAEHHGPRAEGECADRRRSRGARRCRRGSRSRHRRRRRSPAAPGTTACCRRGSCRRGSRPRSRRRPRPRRGARRRRGGSPSRRADPARAREASGMSSHLGVSLYMALMPPSKRCSGRPSSFRAIATDGSGHAVAHELGEPAGTRERLRREAYGLPEAEALPGSGPAPRTAAGAGRGTAPPSRR